MCLCYISIQFLFVVSNKSYIICKFWNFSHCHSLLIDWVWHVLHTEMCTAARTQVPLRVRKQNFGGSVCLSVYSHLVRVVTSYYFVSLGNISHNCCPWPMVCHYLNLRSYLQGQGYKSIVRAITHNCHYAMSEYYLPPPSSKKEG